MRIMRFLFITLVAAQALSASRSRAAEVAPVEHIVSSQVISDVATESPAGLGSGGCADGSCSSDMNHGSVRSSVHGAGGGPVRTVLSGAAGFVGDLRRGAYAGDDCIPRTYGSPDLFYNFYTQGNCNATNAQMYTAPIPVPPNVGHTFVTYQPFMPHEMLYWHTDRFHNYYDGGRGMNHTKVHYYSPPVRQSMSNIYWNYLRIPR